MNEFEVGILEEIQQDRLIQAFEKALLAYCTSDISEHQREKVRKRFLIRTLLAVGGIPWAETDGEISSSDQLRSVLDARQTVLYREAFSACMLCLLAEQSIEWIEENTWRPRFINYLANALDGAVFTRDWRIDTKRMGHEVMPEIRAAVLSTVSEYEKALTSVTSLERAGTARRNLMTVINRPSGRAIFVPFLPEIVVSQLDEVFSRVDAYLEQSGDWGVLDAYNHARQQIERLIDLNRDCGTRYSTALAEQLGSRLLDLLTEDFRGNRAAQSATLGLQPRDKMYPLHTAYSESNLGLLVHNEGPGYADKTRLVVATGDDIEIAKNSQDVQLGRLAPNIRQNIDIPFRVISPKEEVSVCAELTWQNFDGQQGAVTFDFQVHSQRADIDWTALAESNPYSLEPIATENELIGRREVLERLVSTLASVQVGSAIVKGQKRVGKTSIAKAVKSILLKKDFSVVYLEAGDYVDTDAKRTVARLGRGLCRQIKRLRPELRHIVPPEFEDSLSPIAEFLEDVEEVLPDFRIVFILDEFDELPIELYTRGPLGNAFFLTLRSISSRKNAGFLVVGGEKMDRILSFQGAQLNKWRTVQVDYFSRERDWPDYVELIQRPVQGNIDYTENAINRLYEITSGNPYFTNLVCGYVFHHAINARDCYISEDEVEQAIQLSTQELSSNTFQHFWDDGIVEIDAQKVTEKSLGRRRILLAIAETMEEGNPVTSENIGSQRVVRDIVNIEDDLRDFVNRDVLQRDKDAYMFKVDLFSLWLRHRGLSELISSFPEIDANLRRIQEEETLRIGAAEMVELVKKWGVYKGQRISEDKVRAWLEQFGKPRLQRLMFTLLQGAYFYSNAAVRSKLQEIDKIVRSTTVRQIHVGKRKRDDILVSYLDAPGKSGARIASLFADVADIYVELVVEQGKLADEIRQRNQVKAVVFVDDFVGTGSSAAEHLKRIDGILRAATHERSEPLVVIFAAVVAFQKGWKEVELAVQNLETNFLVHYCDLLTQQHQCFSHESLFFPDEVDRDEAKKLALEIGKKLEKQWPLGYGNLELAIVFEDGCPNNSLPILWDESSGQFSWMPLFKRL